eukprot:GHVP01052617.1.p1 GENE.GHVP01052617.1~~GHVP01052617.1.p1  ORF type:complete len:176 (-),score=29.42 GHVP01052617.1:50-505(-)
MKAENGIQQTTRGIWMQTVSHDCGNGEPKPLVVIDVEGTDSRERGDDRRSLENRFALLSLALGDVVIINMNVSAVGTATGSCVSLLNTVLNANFRLFQNESRLVPTILAIFIRDHFPGQTPIQRISEQLSISIEKIQTEIQNELNSKFNEK